MPINSNQEKLDKFNVAIQHYALEQQKKIQQEVEAFQKKELELTQRAMEGLGALPYRKPMA